MKKLIILGAFMTSIFSLLVKAEEPVVNWMIMSEEAHTAAILFFPQNLTGTVNFPSSFKSKKGNEYKAIWLDGFSDSGYDGDCTGVREVILPESLEIIGGVSKLTGLRSMPLPNTMRKIMPHCFYKCESLDSIGFPEGMLDIGEESFKYCKSLSTIVIPSTVFHLPKCFEYCENLHTVVMGKFVQKMDKDLFKTNPRLQKVYFIGEELNPDGFSDVFTSDREVSPEVGKVQIYVPSMYLDLYAYLLPEDYEKYYELLPCPDLFAVFNMECFKVEEGETIPLLYKLVNPGGVEITDVKWESYSPKAVSIENGIAKGLKAGEITRISLMLTDAEGKSYVSECRVQVVNNTGVEMIEAGDTENVPNTKVCVYGLNGMPMGTSTNDLPSGIYIKKQGNNVEKMVVR